VSWDASTWALIIVTGFGTLTVPIALAGYMFGKRTRAEDKAQEFGRVEGELRNLDGTKGGSGLFDRESVALLGSFGEALRNIREDINEIKTNQQLNKNSAEAAHREIRDLVQAQISKLGNDFASLRRQFDTLRAQMTRAINRKGSAG
jgi:hypothetical protein